MAHEVNSADSTSWNTGRRGWKVVNSNAILLLDFQSKFICCSETKLIGSTTHALIKKNLHSWRKMEVEVREAVFARRIYVYKL